MQVRPVFSVFSTTKLEESRIRKNIPQSRFWVSASLVATATPNKKSVLPISPVCQLKGLIRIKLVVNRVRNKLNQFSQLSWRNKPHTFFCLIIKDPFGENRGGFVYKDLLTRLESLHDLLGGKPSSQSTDTSSTETCSSDTPPSTSTDDGWWWGLTVACTASLLNTVVVTATNVQQSHPTTCFLTIDYRCVCAGLWRNRGHCAVFSPGISNILPSCVVFRHRVWLSVLLCNKRCCSFNCPIVMQ